MVSRTARPRKPSDTHGVARLTLTLTVKGEPTHYTISALPSDDPATFGVLRAFRLRKLGRRPHEALSAVYEVVEHLDGGLSCDCQDSQYGPPGHQCKHCRGISRFQEAGILARGMVR